MKITIMRDQLIAALCTAGKSDIRPSLNGVYIEATDMETRLSSTNGSAAALQRADAKGENDVDGGVVRMIVPRHALEGVKNHKVLRTVEINNDGGSWGLVDFSTRTSFVPIDGKFPNIPRVFPRTTSGEVAQFDPELIAAFTKAAKVLGATYKGLAQVAIAHNGRRTPDDKNDTGLHAALVSLGHRQDYTGVIMPMTGEAPTAPPSWALSPLEAEESLV